VAPHIAVPVPVAEGTAEGAAKVIAAKTITCANITRARLGTRIGIVGKVLRVYMALASQGGSCQHGCGDHCNRQKFKVCHFNFFILL
jgi:hypothetical protein